jgi:hypothetical protein
MGGLQEEYRQPPARVQEGRAEMTSRAVNVIKHLRVREANELGATRYRGVCGANGTRRIEYTKSLTLVTCQACWNKLNERWQRKERNVR